MRAQPSRPLTFGLGRPETENPAEPTRLPTHRTEMIKGCCFKPPSLWPLVTNRKRMPQVITTCLCSVGKETGNDQSQEHKAEASGASAPELVVFPAEPLPQRRLRIPFEALSPWDSPSPSAQLPQEERNQEKKTRKPTALGEGHTR